MEHITRAANPAEIAAASVPVGTAKQILPEGMEAERILQLLVPVEFAGTVHRHATIRRLRGRDFALLKSLSGDADTGLLSIMTGLPAAVIAELDAEDFAELSEAAQDFLPRGFRADTGPTSANGLLSPQPSPDTSTFPEVS